MRLRTTLSNLLCGVRHPGLTSLFDIPSHLTSRERLELYGLAQTRGLRHIVEIGSYVGASAAAFAAGLQRASNQEGRVYCVDTWNNDAMTEQRCNTMAAFLANTEAWRASIVPVRGWSTDVASEVAARTGGIDLLFIDGDHSYDGCLADWRAYEPLLRPGARVAFHDVGWAEGVQRVVDEHVRPKVRRQGRLPNLWWGQFE